MAVDEVQRPEAQEDAYALDSTLHDRVVEAVEARDRDRIADLFAPLHPADIADLLEQLSHGERGALLLVWSEGIDGEVLSELEEGVRADVIDLLPAPVLAEAVRDLESDDVVDLLEDLEEDRKASILGILDAADRAAVQDALNYPEESAGRLMQREVVRVPEFWTVGDTIDYLRAQTTDLPDQFYHVILVDPRMKPVGNVTLGRLLSAQRHVALKDIVEDVFMTIPADQPEGEVAYAFNQYHLISVPVVDGDGRLVGVITIDDAMIVLEDEAEEDILRLAGVNDESSLSDSLMETTRRRVPWLVVNLGTAALAALVIAQFEETIAALVALAILMPIVASMGGNAGIQSLTVAVRAIATRDLTRNNTWRFIVREGGVGLMNGLSLAAPLGIATGIIFGSVGIGLVIGSALIINLFVAAMAGTLVPLLLERLRLDPALASGVLVTTVTDVIGFFAFLGLASVFLL
ncbi:magnesium transporter [Rhodobacteraceae bacterium W635]|uniref:magnesium transporter n=1 Tax=Nioella halotolerans TaxID=2303578 RepID=UPI000E3D4184|nr:magnesium transporter [Rhodobacteraceae bacterium W635]